MHTEGNSMSGNKQVIAERIAKAVRSGDAKQCVAIAALCMQHGLRYDDIAALAKLGGIDGPEWESMLYEGDTGDDE